MKIVSLIALSLAPTALAFLTLAPSLPSYMKLNLEPYRTTTEGNRMGSLERRLESQLRTLDQKERQLEKRLRYAEDRRLSHGRGGSVNREMEYPARFNNIVSRAGNVVRQLWESSSITSVQGGALRTWSFANPGIDRVHVLLKTDGRPLCANVELWHGPDYTPHKIKVYLEDGAQQTFSTFIDTPRSPNTIAIRNTGHLEFPLSAVVEPDYEVGEACLDTVKMTYGETIQGGALRTYPFDPTVASVVVLVKTDGRPLNARIELLQGPNNNKQVLEVYTEDGLNRPFFVIIQTPGSGNVVRVINAAPVEFPMSATVAAFESDKTDITDYSDYRKDAFMMGHVW